MRLGLTETTDDGKRAATLLGACALCAAVYLADMCLVKQKSTENLSIFDTLDEHAEAYLSCGLFFPFPSISAFSIL